MSRSGYHRIGRAFMQGDFSIYYYNEKCEDVKDEIAMKFRQNMKKYFSQDCSSSDCRVTKVTVTCGRKSRKKREVNLSEIPVATEHEIVPSNAMSFAKEHADSPGNIIGSSTTKKLLTIAAIYMQPPVGTDDDMQPPVGTDDGNTIEPTKTKHFSTSISESTTMHTNDNELLSSNKTTNTMSFTRSTKKEISYKDIQTPTSTVAHTQSNGTTYSRDNMDIREYSAGIIMPSFSVDDVASADRSLTTSYLNDASSKGTHQQSTSSVSHEFKKGDNTSPDLSISSDISAVVSSYASNDVSTVVASSFPDSFQIVTTQIFTRTLHSTDPLVVQKDETTRGSSLEILTDTLKEIKSTTYAFGYTSTDDQQTSTEIIVQPSFTVHDETSSNIQSIEMSISGDDILSSHVASPYRSSSEMSDVGPATLISSSSTIYDTNSEIVENKRRELTVSFEIYAYLRSTSIYDQIKLMRNLQSVHDDFKRDVDSGMFNMSINVNNIQLTTGELTLSEPEFDPTCLEGQVSFIRSYSAVCGK